MKSPYDWPADVPYPWWRDPVVHARIVFAGLLIALIAAFVWRVTR